MRRTIGVMAAEHIAAGVVENNALIGPVRVYPEPGKEWNGFQGVPAETIVHSIREQIRLASEGAEIQAIGVGFPGIIHNGVVEDSPNLKQVKGLNLQATLSSELKQNKTSIPVLILNDADAMAAGIAATRGQLEKLVRVWTLGNGIGFGRYPQAEGAGEGGHMVVTLEPKENFCGCGGQGHLEGIMGHRAMRLRFLDMEPEEVFANARAGDARCCDFVKLWHRALAAATATHIHVDGPGKFFISGPNSRFIDLKMLSVYLHEMVTMSPLQGSLFELISTSDETAIIGAAVNAERAVFGHSAGA